MADAPDTPASRPRDASGLSAVASEAPAAGLAAAGLALTQVAERVAALRQGASGSAATDPLADLVARLAAIEGRLATMPPPAAADSIGREIGDIGRAVRSIRMLTTLRADGLQQEIADLAATFGALSRELGRPARQAGDPGRPASSSGAVVAAVASPGGAPAGGSDASPDGEPGRLAALPGLAGEVLASGLFDASYYAQRAGIVFASSADAVLHYLAIGERSGIAPSPVFDPRLYRDIHPDLVAYEKPLIEHYLHHGRREGRSARQDSAFMTGARTWRPDLPTVLLVCHDASRTGAPIIGWNLARELAVRVNVVTLLLGKGPLVDSFAEESCFVVASETARGLLAEKVAASALERWPVAFAIVNSVESAGCLPALERAYVPSVTLIHEFVANTLPRTRMVDAVDLSTFVVFPADTVRRAAGERRRGDEPTIHVFPQGICALPAAVDPSRHRPRGACVHPAFQVGADVLVVIGCGLVQIRKGVDLFIACASEVARRLGKDRVRFVWIGAGYDPDRDVGYSVWIEDQIRRLGLAGVVELPGEFGRDDLEEVYRSADLFLLSSRLDPFPNVAIDAMAAGMPVVCFAETTGIADFLAEDEATRSLVAGYLDVTGAADILCRLAESRPARRDLGRLLRQKAKLRLSMDDYATRIEALGLAAKAVADQERADVDLILAEHALDLGLCAPRAAPDDLPNLARRYVRESAAGSHKRRPVAGFDPVGYRRHHPDLQHPPFENPLAHFLRAGRPVGPWTHEIIGPPAEPVTARAVGRAALHLHLFFEELAEEFAAALARNETPVDLLVSTDSAAKFSAIRHVFAAYDRGALILRECPNRGRDIGPLLTGFADVLPSYALVGHLHGKRSDDLGPSMGERWRRFLIGNLIGDRFPMMDHILAVMARRPELGLVFPEDPHLVGWAANRPHAEALASRMALPGALPETIEFPVGTMFWARPAALRPLLSLGLTWDDYPEEPLPVDGSMLHALERLIPIACEAEGFRWAATHVPGCSR